MLKLNLGCGPYPKSGYVNIDINPAWEPALVRDVRKGLPYADSVATEIMASHFLEHLTPVEVLDLLEEAYRVLIPGGMLRIIVPLGVSGAIDHWTTFSERSLNGLCEPDAGKYFSKSFRWTMREREARRDDLPWETTSLHAVLTADKDEGPLLIEASERLTALGKEMVEEGSVLDIGCSDSFPALYDKRKHGRLLGLDLHGPVIEDLRSRYPHWEFRVQDVRDYASDCRFDVMTMLHVAEHLDLWDLGVVLDRLVPHARVFILETPEQYDSNARITAETANVHERHRSLVAADYLARWAFVPRYRYWINDQFSNVIYVRRT